jgi:hypothetical protein
MENRAFKYAFGTGNLSREELDAPPIDQNLDPDDPQVIQDLDLHEYAELKRAQMREFTDAGQLTQEGWLGDNWANFKNRFEKELDHENTWAEDVLKEMQDLKPLVQGANDKEIGPTPVNVFANLYYLTAGDKKPANAAQLLEELRRSAKLVDYLEKQFLPALANWRKAAIDVMAAARANSNALPEVAQQAYSLTATHKMPGLEAMTPKQHNERVRANGKVGDVIVHTSEPYLGSFIITRAEQLKLEEFKDPRGDICYGGYPDKDPYHQKLQIKPASRNEAQTLIEEGEKLIEAILRIIDHPNYKSGVLIFDAMDQYAHAFRNFATYPVEQRKQVQEIYNAGYDAKQGETLVNFSINCTMKAVHSIGLYVKKSMGRYRN